MYGHSRSSILTILRSSSPVLVMLSSMSLSICNHFHTRQAKQWINNHFLEVHPSLIPACAGLFEPRGSRLGLLTSTFNAENFIRRLSWSVSSHFVAIHSSAPENRKTKITKTPWFGVQCHLGSSIMIPLKSTHQCLLRYAAYLCLGLSASFHNRQNNSEKNTF